MNSQKRKPYIRPVTSSWWTNKTEYKKYMLREATAFLLFIFVLEILVLLIIGANKDYASAVVITKFLSHPVVYFVNILIFIAAIYNTYTWFSLTPKAINLVRNDHKVDPTKIRNICYAAVIIISIIFFIIFKVAF